MNTINNKIQLFLISNMLLLTGCQNLYNDDDNVGRNLSASLKPLIINIVDVLYPFLAFIGLIMLSIAFHTLFIKAGNPQESPVSKLLMGVLEFSLAISFISAKAIVQSIFGV